MHRLLLIAALLGLTVATGCCPVPRRALTRPPIQLTVKNTAGEPVKAQLLVAKWSMPHRQYHGYDTFETDTAGVAAIPSERKWEWILPLMIHGVPFYFVTYCVQAAGYAPASGDTHDREPEPVDIVLEPGDGECELPSRRGPAPVPPQ